MAILSVSGDRKTPDADQVKWAIAPANFYANELPSMPPAKRRHGWITAGLCPFHDDTRAGSFRINADSGAFKCFACGAKGADIVAFTMQREGLAFRAALARLADEWGVRA